MILRAHRSLPPHPYAEFLADVRAAALASRSLRGAAAFLGTLAVLMLLIGVL